MNYFELSLAIQRYIETSEAKFVAEIDTFIRASEDTIFSAITSPMFWKTSSSLVTSSGAFDYTLVEGTIDVLGIRLDETIPGNMISGGPYRYLLRKDVDFIFEAYPGGASSQSIPKYYAATSAASSNGNPTLSIRVGPVPDGIYTTEVEYYGKSTTDSITAGGDSKETWLSVTYPSVLLYGALVDAYIFQKGEADVIQYYRDAFDQGMSLIKNLGEERQASDSYSQVGTE